MKTKLEKYRKLVKQAQRLPRGGEWLKAILSAQTIYNELSEAEKVDAVAVAVPFEVANHVRRYIKGKVTERKLQALSKISGYPVRLLKKAAVQAGRLEA